MKTKRVVGILIAYVLTFMTVFTSLPIESFAAGINMITEEEGSNEELGSEENSEEESEEKSEEGSEEKSEIESESSQPAVIVDQTEDFTLEKGKNYLIVNTSDVFWVISAKDGWTNEVKYCEYNVENYSVKASGNKKGNISFGRNSAIILSYDGEEEMQFVLSGKWEENTSAIEECEETAIKEYTFKAGKNYKIVNNSTYGNTYRLQTDILSEGMTYEDYRTSDYSNVFFGEITTAIPTISRNKTMVLSMGETDQKVVYPSIYEKDGISIEECEETTIKEYTFKAGKNYKIVNDSTYGNTYKLQTDILSEGITYEDYRTSDYSSVFFGEVTTTILTITRNKTMVLSMGETDQKVVYPAILEKDGISIEECEETAIKEYTFKAGKNYKIVNDSTYGNTYRLQTDVLSEGITYEDYRTSDYSSVFFGEVTTTNLTITRDKTMVLSMGETDQKVVYPSILEKDGISIEECEETAIKEYTFKAGKNYKIINNSTYGNTYRLQTDVLSEGMTYEDYRTSDYSNVFFGEITTTIPTISRNKTMVLSMGETDQKVVYPSILEKDGISIEECEETAVTKYEIKNSARLALKNESDRIVNYRIKLDEDAFVILSVLNSNNEVYAYHTVTENNTYNITKNNMHSLEIGSENEGKAYVIIPTVYIINNFMTVDNEIETARSLRVECNIQRQLAVYDGEEVTTAQDHVTNYQLKVWNATQNREVKYSKIKDYLFLDGNFIAEGDELEVTISSSKTETKTETITITNLDSMEFETTVIEKCKVEVIGFRNDEKKVVVQLFDESGNRVTGFDIKYSAGKVNAEYVESGKMRVLLMKKDDTFSLAFANLKDVLSFYTENVEYLLVDAEFSVGKVVTFDCSDLVPVSTNHSFLLDNRCSMFTKTDLLSKGTSSEVKIHYEIKENYANQLEDLYLKVMIPEGLSYVENSVVGMKKGARIKKDGDYLLFPVEAENGSGDLSFTFKVEQTGKAMNIICYAIGNFGQNDISAFLGNVLVNTETGLLQVDDIVSGYSIYAYGAVEPGTYVSLYMNGIFVTKVKGNAKGYWNYSFNAEKTTHTYVQIDAVANEDTEEEVRSRKYVMVAPYLPQLTEYSFYYSTHGDMKQIDFLSENRRKSFGYWPYDPFIFVLDFDKDEVSDVKVVSKKNGQEYYIPARLDESTGKWIAKGFFDAAGTSSFVPNNFSVKYSYYGIEYEFGNEEEEEELEITPEMQEALANKLLEKNTKLEYDTIGENTMVCNCTYDDEDGETRVGFEIAVIFPEAEESEKNNALSELDSYFDGCTKTNTISGEMEDYAYTITEYKPDLVLLENEGIKATLDLRGYTFTDLKSGYTVRINMTGYTQTYDQEACVNYISENSNEEAALAQMYSDVVGGVNNPLGEVLGIKNTGSIYRTGMNAFILFSDPSVTMGSDEYKRRVNLILQDIACEVIIDEFTKIPQLFKDGQAILSCTQSYLNMSEEKKGALESFWKSLKEKGDNFWKNFFGKDSDDSEDYTGGYHGVNSNDVYINGSQDPSGYVYETFPENRLEGVKTTLYYKDEDDQSVLWDAEDYEQENPLFTDEQGVYAWDVPEGLWQVKYEKEGYTTNYSEWMEVPPPRLDVNVELVSTEAAKVENVYFYEGAIYVTFDKYVQCSDVLSKIEVLDGENKLEVQVEPVEERTYNEKQVAKTYRTFGNQEYVKGTEYTIEISENISTYAGVSSTQNYSIKKEYLGEYDGIEIDHIKADFEDSKTVELQGYVTGSSEVDFTACELLINVPSFVSVDEQGYSIREDGTFTIKLVKDIPADFEVTLMIKGTDISRTVNVSDDYTTSGYKIHFVSQGGTKVDDIMVYGDFELPQAPEREGYVFIGWFTEAENGGVELTEDTIVDENITVYARWRKQDGIWVKNIPDCEYTGAQIKPLVEVYDGDVMLDLNKDYTISYKNNTNANSKDAVNAPTVIVKAKGNYTGTESITFNIVKKSIGDADITLSGNEYFYDKKVHKNIGTLSWNKKKLKNNVDYVVSFNDQRNDAYKEAGIYEVTITGKGNYTGTRTEYISIAKGKKVTALSVSGLPKSVNYTGNAITPKITVKDGTKILSVGNVISDECDVYVEYLNNIEIGKATVVLHGKGDYCGTKQLTFNITGTNIKTVTVENLPKSLAYTGADLEPEFDVLAKDGSKLKEGSNYIVSYEKNRAAGTATVVIKGIKDYTGTIKKTFKITPYQIKQDDLHYVITMNTNVLYEKGGSKPKPVITFDGETLTEGKDYTLTYKNYAKAEDATKVPEIIVKGKGNYSGTVSLAYSIAKSDMKDLQMAVSDIVYKNKANGWKSAISIYDTNGKKLAAGSDYEKDVLYTYKENTVLLNGEERSADSKVLEKDIPTPGTKLCVTVTGKNNYTGTLTGEYSISKYDLSSAKITVDDQIFTGKEIKPGYDEIKVIVNGVTLTEADYVISEYQNNTNKGSAKVVIVGTGDYCGNKTATFKIKTKGFFWWWTTVKQVSSLEN